MVRLGILREATSEAAERTTQVVVMRTASGSRAALTMRLMMLAALSTTSTPVFKRDTAVCALVSRDGASFPVSSAEKVK